MSSGSCCGLYELWQADEVVTGHCKGEFETELLDAPQHGPCQPADGLAPTEGLLDAFSLLLAHRIAGVPRGPRVDGWPPLSLPSRARLECPVPHSKSNAAPRGYSWPLQAN